MQRLSPGTLILGIFAVLFGLVGAYAVKKYTQDQPAPVACPWPSWTCRPVVPSPKAT